MWRTASGGIAGCGCWSRRGGPRSILELEYNGGTKIYVPSAKIELVQKYVGGKGARVVLANIGGKAWVKQKEAAQKAVTDLAAEMIELQAARDARPGIAFPPDTEWQREFDAAFPYQETPDQLTSIDDIKRDMQASRPMDRLLCGDVGFGKTEMAIRAAFKAIDAGLPGGGAGADDGAGRAASPDVHGADGGVSVSDRMRSRGSARRRSSARLSSGRRRGSSIFSSARIGWRRRMCSFRTWGS